MEEQQKNGTEVVGGYDDITINEIYREFAPKSQVPPCISQMFAHTYYPVFGAAKPTYGIYRSRAEADINVAEDDYEESEESEDDEEKKITARRRGIIGRIQRHSKRLICSIIGKNSEGLKDGLINPVNRSGKKGVTAIRESSYVHPIKPDTDGVKECAAKLLEGISSLRAAKNLQNYIIKQEEAETTSTTVNSMSGIAYAAMEHVQQSAQYLLSHYYYKTKESLLLLKLFYKQFPLVNRKRRENLERLVPHIQDCMSFFKVSLYSVFS